MNSLLILATLNLKEYFRRKIYIIIILSIVVVAGTVLIANPFTIGVQTHLLRDLALTFIQFSSILFSLALAAAALPNEIERKLIYPFISRPISRGSYLWGKFIAIMLLVGLNDFLMGSELIFIVYKTSGGLQPIILVGSFLIFLESMVIASLSLWLSTFLTVPVNFAGVFLLYVIGSLSHIYTMSLTTGNDFAQWTLLHLKSVLPYFDYFSIKSAITHDHPVTLAYLSATTLYGICYLVLFMILAELSFIRKDL